MNLLLFGIMERASYNFEGYGDPGYSIISTNYNDGKSQAYISLKNPKNYKKEIPKILGVDSYEKITEQSKYESFDRNVELLRWESFAFNNETVVMLYSVVGIVIFIIIFTSVFCIRNSFAIATTEKMKMYGMLASIGATRKQIKKNVIFESLLLGIIAIPIGILSGIIAVYILMQIVNSLIGENLLSNVNGIIVKVTWLPIFISAILGVVTIYLSAISSAKKASKVSPIDLVRSPEKIKMKARKLKVPKAISKLFKTGGELAYKNLKRSKKKYRTTVISLSVSICIFITMNALLTNMFDLTDNYYQDYDYNLVIYCSNNPKEQIEKITNLNNIDEYFLLYRSDDYLKIFDENKVNKMEGTEELEIIDNDNEETKNLPSGKAFKLQIIGLDDNTFQKYTKKIGVNYEQVKQFGILCDNYVYYQNNSSKQVEKRRYKYEKNDTITGFWKDKEINIKVGAITDQKPYGIENQHYMDGYLIVNMEEYKDIDFKLNYLTIQSSNTEKLVEEIENIKIENIYITNFEESAKEQRAMGIVIKIFLYGFISVITLIGVTNIFNTITSNMELRQKEFAMLKSIGMTKKEFNRMINLETIFYSSKSLIYGITLGLLGTFALYEAFSVKIARGVYIPINAIIISIIAVFILVFIIMKYSMAKINKQNTIETIRNENI